MAEKTFQLEVVTPDRTIFSEAVRWVVVPGESGDFQVLPGHTPLLASLGIGLLTADTEKGRHYLSITGGFCEVMPDRTVILARAAESAKTIDRDRAAAARDRAMQRLSERGTKESVDVDRAKQARARAENRIHVSGMK